MSLLKGVICRLSVEFHDEFGEIVARCPELRISNHGKTQDEARGSLFRSVSKFFDVCAENGTLFEVLNERKVTHAEVISDNEPTLDVPIPVQAWENSRRTAG